MASNYGSEFHFCLRDRSETHFCRSETHFCLRAQSEDFFTPLPPIIPIPLLLIFGKFSNLPPLSRLFQPNPPIIRYSRVAIRINIKAFNRVNGKQFNILKTFLKCLENYIVTFTY